MSQTIGELLREATAYLSIRGLENPRADAEYLLSFLFGKGRAFLIGHREEPVDSLTADRYRDWIEKRGDDFPIQYLTGLQEFYGRVFRVNPAVLIPRPETEFVVEAALDLLRQNTHFSQILDIGTGSGCIAVTLACERPDLNVTATDLSSTALAVARENAATHDCLDRIVFLEGRSLEPISARAEHFNLIVSNPPYIGHSERDAVAPDVLKYEPATALFAGEDGTELIREIFSQAPAFLSTGGFLVFEVGFQQAERVKQLGGILGWTHIESRFDLSGIERCLVFRRT